jgi:hypothetical protein
MLIKALVNSRTTVVTHHPPNIAAISISQVILVFSLLRIGHWHFFFFTRPFFVSYRTKQRNIVGRRVLSTVKRIASLQTFVRFQRFGARDVTGSHDRRTRFSVSFLPCLLPVRGDSRDSEPARSQAHTEEHIDKMQVSRAHTHNRKVYTGAA